MSLIKRVKSTWIDLPDWPILSVMQASSSAILLSILSTVSLLACGADTPETADARVDIPRADARTTPLPDARIFPPFVDAMPLPDAGPECDDPSEPNDTENTSTALVSPMPPFTDCDDTGGTVSGAVDSEDEDWYSYTAVDDGFCVVDPTVTVATGNVEVCLFLKCTDTDATEEITCPAGSTATTVGTIEGCCGTSGFEIDFNCDGTGDETATNFIRVKSAGQDSCETYSVGYHY